jgi:hypothetical protein
LTTYSSGVKFNIGNAKNDWRFADISPFIFRFSFDPTGLAKLYERLVWIEKGELQ